MASSLPNKLFPNQSGFPTPNFPTVGEGCRTFNLPADEEYFALLMGALNPLTKPYNWYQNGEMTQDEAAEFFLNMIQETMEAAAETVCEPNVRAPYWDSEEDNETELPADEQTWYGAVSDWLAPADDLNFVQNIALWVLTGFVAYAATPAAAIFFRTTAKRFIIAVETTDIPEVIRVIVGASTYTEKIVDTTDFPNQIIELEFVSDDEETDIYIIQGVL